VQNKGYLLTYLLNKGARSVTAHTSAKQSGIPDRCMNEKPSSYIAGNNKSRPYQRQADTTPCDPIWRNKLVLTYCLAILSVLELIRIFLPYITYTRDR